MATVNDIGTPGAPLSTPPLTAWQAAVRDAINRTTTNDVWTAYTPTLTGFTASSLDCAYYRSPGGLVTVSAAVVVSAVSAAMSVSLPAAPVRTSNGPAWVTVASTHYAGILRCGGAATTATLWVFDAAAAYARATQAGVGVPAAWSAGAAFQFEITYQAAPLP